MYEIITRTSVQSSELSREFKLFLLFFYAEFIGIVTMTMTNSRLLCFRPKLDGCQWLPILAS